MNNNKISLKKTKIRNLLYTLSEESFPKEEKFLKSINNIKINLSNGELASEQNYCIGKVEFINYEKNNKLEKYVIFASDFQLNLFSDLDEIFIDATFKVALRNWCRLLNIFGYIKNKKFYSLRAHILMNSKTVQLYEEVFSQFIKKN